MSLITENRQTIKITLLIIFFSGLCLNMSGQIQKDKTKIDYSIRSNIIDPDTLTGDQKLLFIHFADWTHEEVIEITPEEIKIEFAKLDIFTLENDRFVQAYFFLRSDIKHHKKSVENWEHFKDLVPDNKKPE